MSDNLKLSEIELWPVDKLVPFESNAKLHPPEQIAALVRSIKTQGFRNKPIEVKPDGWR